MALLMAVMAFAISGVAVSATAGDVIYFEMPSSWSTPYCHAFTGGTSVTSWPGEKMTLVEDNVYAYVIPGSQQSVVFNNGNDSYQTVDIKMDGTNKIYKITSNATSKQAVGAWSDYTGTPLPTDPTQPTQPTSPSQPVGTGAVAACTNEANWSSVYVYYWTDSNKPIEWPGTKLTDADTDALGNYVVNLPADCVGGVIFNNGGGVQSDDFFISQGESKIYNNKTRVWEDYDAGALQMKVSTDLKSPQYDEIDITISAIAAGGNGDISYKYSVVKDDQTTVLKDYSKDTSVVWTPMVEGDYEIVVDVKDTDGNTNSRTIAYTILNADNSVKPVIKKVAPVTGEEIQINEEAEVEITAAGGKVGTNLLFYKVEVFDPDNQIVQDAYYTRVNCVAFTPKKLGDYTVKSYVQNSDNTTVSKTSVITCSENVTNELRISSLSTNVQGLDFPEGQAVEFTATAQGGQAPYEFMYSVNDEIVQAYSENNTFIWDAATAGKYNITVTVKDANGTTAQRSRTYNIYGDIDYKMGDVDFNGEVELEDVVLIMKNLAKTYPFSEKQIELADVNKSGDVDLEDAVTIQKYLAHMINTL